ncbi:MAG: hypothetical protein USCAAHI_00807 [Beijerinckiaceae bacterium]|nr:MAG: hypothetical protein USCAAHI_00807 [Beijerinckiaceae bacterium]
MIPSQQSSLSVTRTALIFQASIALTEVWSIGPSAIPVLSYVQRLSNTARLTPRSWRSCPAPFTRRWSCTLSVGEPPRDSSMRWSRVSAASTVPPDATLAACAAKGSASTAANKTRHV